MTLWSPVTSQVTLNSQSEHTLVINVNNLILQQPKAITEAPSDVDVISTKSDISVLSVATESEQSASSLAFNNEKLKNRDSSFGNSYYYGSDSEVLRAKCGGKKRRSDAKKCKNACEEAYVKACKDLNCYKKLKKKSKRLCKVYCINEFYWIKL